MRTTHIGGGKGDGRLLRAQAAAGLADDHPTGAEVARYLLGAKLAGQVRLAREVLESPATADTVAALAAALEVAENVEEARQLEASAAAAYFAAWCGHAATSPTFARADLRRVPQHWHTYDGRRSLIGQQRTTA